MFTVDAAMNTMTWMTIFQAACFEVLYKNELQR